MKHLNLRFVKRQHRFVINVINLNSLLLGLVAITNKNMVQMRYGVYSLEGTEIMVWVNIELNYAEADLIRCKLNSEDVNFRCEIV